MNVGFIGFGEVGFELARGIRNEGADAVFAFDPMANDPKLGKLVHERVAEAGATLLHTPVEVARSASVIISSAPGSRALQAARSVIGALGDGHVYADVSTVTAATKKRIADEVAAKGATFVDGAMMGGLSMYHHKVPTLVSGSGSDRFIEALAPYGMCLSKVSERPGDAIAIKLVRSIAMKGLATLAAETLEAAVKLNVDSEVLDSIKETLTADTFQVTLDWLVSASCIHAHRQVHEMEDVVLMMRELGVDPSMTVGTIKRLEWMESKNFKDKFQGRKPKTWRECADVWD